MANKTMHVKYEDGSRRQDIPLIGKTVDRGETIEVDVEVGQQLLEQGWVESKKSSNTTTGQTDKPAASKDKE